MSISRRTLLHAGLAVLAVAGCAAAWTWAPLAEWTAPERLRDAFAPYRTRWYCLPLVLCGFVVAELLFFPVLALVFVCGLAFGPWLGCAYAMLGSLAGAVPPFYVGRWLGRRRLVEWGGAPARRMAEMLRRRGLIAVFLVRKIPAPYSAVNMLCGACGVSLRDLLLGTLLGMATGIVLITVVGGQLGEIVSEGSANTLWPALGVLATTIALVVPLQLLLNRRLEKPA